MKNSSLKDLDNDDISIKDLLQEIRSIREASEKERPKGSVALTSKRAFAFFSAENHSRNGDVGTYPMLNADGIQVLVNYSGPMIDGLPGIIRNGNVIRPERYETYELLGEIGGPERGKLVRYEPPINAKYSR